MFSAVDKSERNDSKSEQDDLTGFRQVQDRLKNKCGVHLNYIDASEIFLAGLRGVTEPEKKRKIIGNTFIEVFDAEAKTHGAEFLLQVRSHRNNAICSDMERR